MAADDAAAAASRLSDDYTAAASAVAEKRRYVLDRALRQSHIWADCGRPMRVAVNLSARNLLDEGLPATVQRLLTLRAVPANMLELEVTESALMREPGREVAQGYHHSKPMSVDRFDDWYLTRPIVRFEADPVGGGRMIQPVDDAPERSSSPQVRVSSSRRHHGMSNGRVWRRAWVAGLGFLLVGCGATSATNTDARAQGSDRSSVPSTHTHATTSMHPRRSGPPAGPPTTARVDPTPVRHSPGARHRAGRPHGHGRRHGKPVTAVHHDGVPRADVPDVRLTPGAVLTASAATVCVVGYSSSVRDVPSAVSEEAYQRYGVVHVPYAHEVDHLVSLELGGSNAITNLWPEPYAGRWGARTKDVLENRLHSLVCAGELNLRMAQHQEARDWVGAYRRYVGSAPSRPSTGGSRVSNRPTGPGCEPGYSPCLPRAADLNCDDIAAANKPVHVTGDDPYGLDGDADGSACEP